MDEFNPFEDPDVVLASRKNEKIDQVQLTNQINKNEDNFYSENLPTKNTNTNDNSIDNLLTKLNQPYSNNNNSNNQNSNEFNYAQQENKKQEFADGEAELLRKKQELDFKAAELDRREKELSAKQGSSPNNKAKNFPPFPNWFPFKPWYYINVSEEIPLVNQWLCSMFFRMWYVYSFTLLLNILTNLAYLMVNKSIVSFIISIILGLLFIALSFVCVIIPLYKSFKTDSSFNYFIFFLTGSIHCLVTFIQALGISDSGWSGWITAAECLGDANKYGAGIFMISTSILFTLVFLFSAYGIIQVNRIYRGSTASFEKAKSELMKNVAKSAV